MSFLVGLVYRALFMKGEEGFRAAHPLSKALYVASVGLALCQMTHRAPALLALLLVNSALGIYWPGPSWLYSSLIISSLPAAWLAATAFIGGYVGLPPVDPLSAFSIFVKAEAASLSILFAASILSPASICNAMIRAGSRHAYVPLLVWRIIPYSLRALEDSLGVGALKGEKAHKRLPSAVAALYEHASYVEEYAWFKLEARPKKPLPMERSRLATLVLIAGSAAVALASCLL